MELTSEDEFHLQAERGKCVSVLDLSSGFGGLI
jgi:hypothetical protein